MSPPSSIVYLEIDNRQCALASAQCFQSAADVAAFLGALASLGSLDIPYKIEAVQSEYLIPFNSWHLLPFGNPGLCLSPAPLLPLLPMGQCSYPAWEVLFWNFLAGLLLSL